MSSTFVVVNSLKQDHSKVRWRSALSMLAMVLTLSLSAAPDLGLKSDLLSTDNNFSAQLNDLSTTQFLPVEQAFALSLQGDSDSDGAPLLKLRWQIAPGYYLYQHRIAISNQAGEAIELTLPAGKQKTDEYFGDIEVYYQSLEATVNSTALPGGILNVRSQGCADKGLCYPPQDQHFRLSGGGGVLLPVNGHQSVQAASSPEFAQDSLTAQLFSGSLASSLLLFFLAGIGLAFTPCVLPMVPILSGIIVGSGVTSKGKALLLSLAYVLPMAISYAVIGVIVASLGAGFNVQALMQAPVVLVVMASLFVVLSLAMFDVYTLQIPLRWQNKLNALSQRQSGGQYVGVAIMGVLSSLVVSPCISAPLVGALSYIAVSGDTTTGGLALLLLGLGMGLPLLVIGVFGGHYLPKAGGWMDAVKAVFGLMLIGTAIWLIGRIVPDWLNLGLWAALALFSAYHFGAFNLTGVKRALWWSKGVAYICLVYAGVATVGVFSGGNDPLRPLANFGVAAQHEIAFKAVSNSAELDQEIALAQQQGRPLLLDFYADWCVSCKVMEQRVFIADNVFPLMQQFVVIRADVTANNVEHQSLLNRFGLFGPPSLIFFSNQGYEISNARIQGEQNATEFAAHLQGILSAQVNVGVASAGSENKALANEF